MRILPYGECALLVEVADLDAALALLRVLAQDRAIGVTDLVPAARTVLVAVDPRILPLDATRRWIESVAARPAASADSSAARRHTIPVVYNGADLVPLAAELGWSVAELVAAHSGREWTVAFGGFAPGFAYLSPEGDPAWPEIPRLAVPRTSVPAGSVAVAGGFAGVYPRVSPGGWRLLGHTDAPLWDAHRTPPALLAPGDVVRFEAET